MKWRENFFQQDGKKGGCPHAHFEPLHEESGVEITNLDMNATEKEAFRLDLIRSVSGRRSAGRETLTGRCTLNVIQRLEVRTLEDCRSSPILGKRRV